ncbi:hypothetical protein D3C79_877040 [compost metagenome]
MPGFAALHARVQWHQGGADALQGAGGDDPFPQVGRPHRHPVGHLYLQGQQGAGGLLAQLVKLAVADDLPTVFDGRLVGVFPGRVGEQLGDGLSVFDRQHDASSG